MTTRGFVTTLLASAVGVLSGAVMLAQTHAGHENHATSGALKTPEPLSIEHRELHEALAAASKLSGHTGSAARHVADVLHPHFVSEEEYALPPLGLLSSIAAGRFPGDTREAIAMADRLKASLPRMLDEHKAIVAALDDLERAARAEQHADVLRFVDGLKLHAQTEEQVLYPAAILVGEYLKTTAAKR